MDGVSLLRDCLSEFHFQQAQSLRSEFSELVKRWNNRTTFERLILSEEYRQGSRLNITLEFNVRNSETYYVQYVPASNADLKAFEAERSKLNVGGSNANNGYDRRQQDVFVSDVQVVQGDEMAFLVPSFVRFYRVGDNFDDLRKTLQYSLSGTDAGYKFIPRFTDLNLSLRPNLAVSDIPNDFTISEIESGAQVMNCITEDKGYFPGKVFCHRQPQDVLSGIFIELYSKRAEVRLEKSIQDIVQIRDVLVGPFDL